MLFGHWKLSEDLTFVRVTSHSINWSIVYCARDAFTVGQTDCSGLKTAQYCPQAIHYVVSYYPTNVSTTAKYYLPPKGTSHKTAAFEKGFCSVELFIEACLDSYLRYITWTDSWKRIGYNSDSVFARHQMC